jgi:hypothetical protein
MSLWMRLGAWTFGALLAASTSSFAQGTRGTISGTVAGPTGAPQGNITLIVTNLATGIDRRGASETTGEFVFGGLTAGTYRLRVEDDTFAPWSQDSIVLAGGATVAIKITLAPRVAAAPAPTARATVAGTVIGPEGRPLGNATIIITNAAGVDRRGVSEQSGAYTFGGLQPGVYHMRVEESAALPYASGDITLGPGVQQQLDIRLQPLPPPPVSLTPAAAAPGAPATPATPAQPTVKNTTPKPPKAPKVKPSDVPEVTAANGEFEAKPDRWRFQYPAYTRYDPPQSMPFVESTGPFDSYHQNTAKADFPIAGNSIFANLNLQFNSNLNPREVGAGAETQQLFYNQNIVAGLEIFKGDTVFQPKSWAVRATGVFNLNALAVGSLSLGDLQKNTKPGLEEGFVEKRLSVFDASFDFASVRVGMQNFNSDFRGFLFDDNQLGVRIFGNAASNRHQYNLAYFSMRDRDPTSQLHDVTASRNQSVFIANYYIQDFGAKGYTAMVNVHVNHDQGPGADAATGQVADPHALNVTYLGFHGDGKWGAWSVDHAYYYAFGKDDFNKIAGGPVDIAASMAALELSRDADWKRYRLSLFYASGDDRSDPTKAKGFDSIMDNPNFAGGQFQFWTQQKTTVTDGPPVNGVAPVLLITEKFTLLPSLRSKFTQRSNFVNPGLILLNAGVDLRMSPSLKVVTNASYLKFADATVPRQLLQQRGLPGFEDNTIGLDLSAGAKWRPFLNENFFIVPGVSMLKPSGGFATALGSTSPLFSAFATVQVNY